MIENPNFLYGSGIIRRSIARQYSYFLQPYDVTIPPYNVPPFSTETGYPLPFDINTVKQYLKIDVANTADDALIGMIMQAVVNFAEKYTKRDFIIKKYLTYRDNFNNSIITLRKSLLQNIISFEYLVNGVFTAVPSVYYATTDSDFSSVLLLNNDAWPNNIDTRQQAIKILFNAGYGTTSSSIPYNLQLGMLQHIAQLYENRGDCSSTGGSDCGSNIPSAAKLIYDEYRIRDISTEVY
jgi:uncharacterized phiE125 gp8 family phage protein